MIEINLHNDSSIFFFLFIQNPEAPNFFTRPVQNPLPDSLIAFLYWDLLLNPEYQQGSVCEMRGSHLDEGVKGGDWLLDRVCSVRKRFSEVWKFPPADRFR